MWNRRLLATGISGAFLLLATGLVLCVGNSLREHYQRPTNAALNSLTLERNVSELELRGRPMSSAVERLRRLGFRICFEEGTAAGSVGEFPVLGTSSISESHSISLSIQNQSLRQVLNELVAQDRDYLWEAPNGTDLVNIMPRHSHLDFQVKDIAIRNESVFAVYSLPRNAGCRYGFELTGDLKNSAHIINRRFTIVAQRARFRDVLNEAVASHNEMCWTANAKQRLAFHDLPNE